MVTENKRMFQRRRTAAQWTSENPVLGAGEIGVITDEVPSFKIGDGTTAWNSLNTNPDLASSDTAKMSLSTSAGITTLNVTNLAWVPVVARRTTDAVKNNTTTFADDTELFVPVASNAVYEIRMYLIYTSVTVTPDIKMTWTGPAGSTFLWASYSAQTGSNAFSSLINHQHLTMSETGTAGVGIAADDMHGRPGGILTTAGTSGNLQFRWAQNTLTAEDTTIRAGSTLIAQRIA